MRIISGKYRGMKLAEFCGISIRPTADRVKESLFNILSGEIGGARVLDLFCGSGNLGIECLSRGAASVHFNDISKDSLNVLNKNLKKIGAAEAKVTNSDYAVCLKSAAPFDLIFIDPPYKTEYGKIALEIIGAEKLLLKNGIAVFESDKSFSAETDGLELYDERKYGITYLSFFRLK